MKKSRILTLVVLCGLLIGVYSLLFWPSERPITEAQEQVSVQIDDSSVVATYSNLCRVTATRREVFFDFAVSVRSGKSGQAQVPINRRIVTNLYTAKRMLHAMKLTVQRHEAAFGVLRGQDGSNQDSEEVELDASRVLPSYANFCRVTGTPEELILDFGLNPQPFGVPAKPIPVQWRILANFFTGKQLVLDLESAIKRYEAAHGELETDVRRRLRPEALTLPEQ